MKSIRVICLLSLCYFLVCSCSSDNKEKKQTTALEELIFPARKIEVEKTDSLTVDSFITANPQYKPFRKKIHKFYARRSYQLAWSDKGVINPHADMFINIVEHLEEEGLNPNKEEAGRLRSRYMLTSSAKKPWRPEIAQLRKEIDLLLTANYFKYAKTIWKGKIDPNHEHLEWFVQGKKIKYGKMLDAILSNNAKTNTFIELEPVHPEYRQLKNCLYKYRTIQQKGGLPQIPANVKKLAKGDTNQQVVTLRKILFLTGDLKAASADSIFDESLVNAVKHFQKRHGIRADGVVEAKTLKELNVPVEDRITQIIVNMERWRWVPEKIADSFLLVNIPEYKLHVYENNKEVWDMNVIVGKAATHTPIFNDELEFIVMSPHWNVPQSIAVNEILPTLQKDSTFLLRQNMEIFKGGDYKNPVDPTQIDWRSQDITKFNYTFRQKPGTGNALGNVKFVFPNEYDVYLHDTPTGHLFSQDERGFSHGCIRIQEPVKLAEYLLQEDPTWNQELIKKTIYGGEERFVKLKKKIPVYILYFTTWVDKDGNLNFRHDIYGHDKKLKDVLFE